MKHLNDYRGIPIWCKTEQEFLFVLEYGHKCTCTLNKGAFAKYLDKTAITITDNGAILHRLFPLEPCVLASDFMPKVNPKVQSEFDITYKSPQNCRSSFNNLDPL